MRERVDPDTVPLAHATAGVVRVIGRRWPLALEGPIVYVVIGDLRGLRGVVTKELEAHLGLESIDHYAHQRGKDGSRARRRAQAWSGVRASMSPILREGKSVIVDAEMATHDLMESFVDFCFSESVRGVIAVDPTCTEEDEDGIFTAVWWLVD